MSKRRRTTLAISAALVAALLVWAFFASREPTYEGRSLSDWLTAGVYYEDEYYYTDGTPFPRDAIQHIGTNAIPYLLEWIQYEPSPWKTKLRNTVNRSLRLLNKKWRLTDKDEILASCVSWTFLFLGPKARAAIPELTRIMNDPKGGDPQRRAASVLGYLGEEAFHPLMAALTNQQGKVRREALRGMGSLGTNAARGVPVFVEYLSDQDQDLACEAALTLSRLTLEPKTVVPALMHSLTDSRPKVRVSAIIALSRFGTESSVALPQLIQCLQDKQTSVPKYAARTLGRLKLDPHLVVPALAASLRHNNADVRREALDALAEFSTNARPADPALVKLLSDSDLLVRLAATNALLRIDPTVLENATNP